MTALRHRREIISVAQMRAIDAGAGVATRALMENAGAAVAAAIAARFAPGSVAVLCGPGANGGDGYVAARLLAARGWPVWVEALGAPQGGDAAAAAAAWTGETRALTGAPGEAAVYVDALFGAGLNRPLDGAAGEVAQFLHAVRGRVVAVDLPSGLSGDLGGPEGPCAAAALTVTFVRKKPAHVLAPGRFLCGEIVCAEIGTGDAIVEAQRISMWENDPALWGAQFPWPDWQAHKHARGRAGIASGGFARSGAARLAAMAALRAGAGLSTLFAPSETLPEIAAQITSVMARACDTGQSLAAAAAQSDAFLIGPGFGLEAAQREKLKAVLDCAQRGPLVLDADALTLIGAGRPGLAARDAATPHAGEFERLFPGLLATSATKIEAARAGARALGAVVLLKGPDTVIAAPDGRAIVNTRGTPFLATAGSGDVLAGVITGLMAQGMDGFAASAAAAWLHGACAEAVGPGLVSDDLIAALPKVLNDLAPQFLKRAAGAR